MTVMQIYCINYCIAYTFWIMLTDINLISPVHTINFVKHTNVVLTTPNQRGSLIPTNKAIGKLSVVIKGKKLTNPFLNQRRKRTYRRNSVLPNSAIRDVDLVTYPAVFQAFGVIIVALMLCIIINCIRSKWKDKHIIQIIEGDYTKRRPSWSLEMPVPRLSNAGWDINETGPSITYVNSKTLKLDTDSQHYSVSGAIYKVGFSTGKHIFAYMWPRNQKHKPGTMLCIGIGYRMKLNPNPEYNIYLQGATRKSLSFDLINKCLLYDGNFVGKYPKGKTKSYCIPTLVYMYLDLDEYTVAFSSDEEYWGEAFRFNEVLKTETGHMYPMIACRGISGKLMIFYKGEVNLNSEDHTHKNSNYSTVTHADDLTKTAGTFSDTFSQTGASTSQVCKTKNLKQNKHFIGTVPKGSAVKSKQLLNACYNNDVSIVSGNEHYCLPSTSYGNQNVAVMSKTMQTQVNNHQNDKSKKENPKLSNSHKMVDLTTNGLSGPHTLIPCNENKVFEKITTRSQAHSSESMCCQNNNNCISVIQTRKVFEPTKFEYDTEHLATSYINPTFCYQEEEEEEEEAITSHL